jgi:hypothetical protein
MSNISRFENILENDLHEKTSQFQLKEIEDNREETQYSFVCKKKEAAKTIFLVESR